MTTLVGLDLAARRVLVVGGGAVGTRRAAALAGDGAHVVLVDPAPSDEARLLASSPTVGRVELVERPVTEADVHEAWLVVAATADEAVDDAVTQWCLKRRTWCIRGQTGTARSVASSRHGDLLLGVVSTGVPDPRRVAGVRDALARHVASGAVDLRRRRQHEGSVVLVGSGPGDPGLITVTGLQAISTADVVVTDRSAATGLLEHLPPDVEVVDVGTTSASHPVPQTEINRLLVERARRGLTVVRLEGGDPFVDGQGGEEVHACLAARVAVSVVPGVSSALAAPALAGIPVTRRGVASTFVVSSGHAGAERGAVAALAEGATLVLPRAVGSLPEICRTALGAGVPPDLPVAVVERASTSHPRVIRATLDTAAETVVRMRVRAPAVVVMGRVAAEHVVDAATRTTEASDG